MSEVRVGVIGVGNIGQDHIKRLTRTLHGARVVAVSDVDTPRAREVAERLDATMYPTGQELIGAAEVDGVLVASWGLTHESYVLAGIEAGKPIFCEKPLATTIDACLRIVNAEVARGHRLVQVGFMRRYDPPYVAMRRTLASGELGAPLIVHCAHRNVSAPSHFTGDMLLNDAGIHEIDITRWLLDDEIARIRVLKPRRPAASSASFDDPLLLLFETRGGVLVDVEVFANAGYGYEITCEVVAERGTVSLPRPGNAIVRMRGQASSGIDADWRERFARAYEIELQDWLDGIQAGEHRGPSAWDGYAATAAAEAGVRALSTGEAVEVTLEPRPAFYAA